MNVNKVFFGGRITRDLELRYIPSGTAVCSFGIVANRKKDGQDIPTFVEVTAWGKTAENLCQYKGKGDSIFVEGSLEYSSWDDKETGKKRSKVAITAHSIQFLPSANKQAQQDDGIPPAFPEDDDNEPF